MDVFLAEFDTAMGLIVIIAYLLGMGTSRSRGTKERRSGATERRQGPASELQQILTMLEYLTFPHRPAEPEPSSEDPEDGAT